MRLQRKLLLTFLPIVLLPLAIAGGWSGIISKQQVKRQAELRLTNQAKLSAALTYKELARKMTALSALAFNPVIVQESRKAAEQAQAEKLPAQSIAAVESQFAKTRRLNPQPSLQQYLQDTALQNNFVELYFTERHGFNVAYAHPPNDFVQSDDLWWQAGKQYGQWIKIPKFDVAKNHITISLAHEITDPNSKEFLGVLRAGYDAAELDHLTGELQNLKLLNSESIQILAIDEEVVTLATLSSQLNTTKQAIVGGNGILQDAREFLKIAQKRIAENHEATDREEFDIMTRIFIRGNRWYAIAKVPGTNWVTISSVEAKQINAATNQLISIFAGVFLSLAAIATLVILRVSHHLSAPLNHLAQVAQQATKKGDFTAQIPVNTRDEEISVLADSFEKLLQHVQELLNEQTEVRHQLEEANQTLEDKVNHRTEELQAQTQRLEQTLQELQRTQAQVVQNEKMSSLGQLVAGIAHEINNPVSFIHGNLGYIKNNAEDLLLLLSLYEQEYPKPTPAIVDKLEDMDLEFLKADIPKSLDSMRLGTDRIREIIKSLRVFSRLDEADVKAIDLHEGIDSTLMILQNRLKAKPDRLEIEVIKNYGQIPPVECYAGQLNQVFMNILTNAIDALEELLLKRPNHHPQIRISTQALDAQTVQITIADNGTGIPEAIQQRIFDPFFTTKAVGKGTGMGMSISYQVITEKHGGQLTCVSVPGEGTEFMIQIPICQIVCESLFLEARSVAEVNT